MDRSDTRVGAPWLLCVLAFGVIAMHHVGMPSHSHIACAHPPAHSVSAAAAASSHPPPGDVPTTLAVRPPGCGPVHDMFHLCLAIMGWLLLLVAWFALRHREGCLSWRDASTANLGSSARAPPRIGSRNFLSLTCVLRI